MVPKTTFKHFYDLLGKLDQREKEKWEAKRRSTQYQKDWDNAFDKYIKDRVLKDYVDDNGDHTEEEIEHNLRSSNNLFYGFIFHTEEEIVHNTYNNPFYDFLFSDEGKELANNHGMEFAYHYDAPLWPENKLDDKPCFIPVFKNSAPMTLLPVDSIKVPFSAISKYYHTPDLSKLREGRFLGVDIDLQHPMVNIMAFLNYYIDKYSNLINQPKRKRATKVDYMKVWDMIAKGMNRYEITKELFPDSVGTVDFHVNYKRIDRALKKAEKEIGEAHKQATE